MTYPPPSGPPSAYGGPGAGYPPPGYGPAAGAYGSNDLRSARLAELTQSAHNWLLFCVLGWFLGYMWLSGPIAWYQGTQFRREIESFGAVVPSQVSDLRRFGIVTTAFFVLMLLLGLLAVLAMALGAVAWSARAQ